MSPELQLADAAKGAAAELLALVRKELREIDLPAYQQRAESLAGIAVALARDYATGAIDSTQLAAGKKDLLLAARSYAACGGIDLLGRRRSLVEGSVSMLLRIAVSIASGGTLV